MKTVRPLNAILPLVLLLAAESAFAFRCGSELVAVGDSRYEVGAYCGLPDDATARTVYRSVTNGAVVNCETLRVHTVESLATRPRDAGRQAGRQAPQSCLRLVEDRLAVAVEAESWLYDFGRNRFMRRVHFEDGVVVRIEKLGYGVKPRR